MRKRFRWIVLALAAVFFAFIFADTQGVFDDRPYMEVPHGNHSHYLPWDCGEELDAGRFPTRPPGPNERITCDGRFVPVEQ